MRRHWALGTAAPRRAAARVRRALTFALTLLGATTACDLGGQRGGSAGRGAPSQQRAATHMDTFTWNATNSAPAGCPMRLIAGDLLVKGGTGSVPVPRASVLRPGWGDAASAEALDDDGQPPPDSLDVLFFSYLEDKIYRGTFALPKDSITRLFRKGFLTAQEPSGRGKFDELVVGVAPGGAVAVWAAGVGRHVEVFFGQAQPVDLDWHQTLEIPPNVDRARYVRDVLAEAAKGDPLVVCMQQHLPLGQWAAYRTRYRWRPAFEGLPTVEPRPIKFVNGESVAEGVPLDAAEQARMPVPSLLWLGDSAANHSYKVRFDPEEAVAAFARVGAGDAPVELVFAAPPAGAPAGGPPLGVSVRGASETIPLRRAKVERYRMR